MKLDSMLKYLLMIGLVAAFSITLGCGLTKTTRVHEGSPSVDPAAFQVKTKLIDFRETFDSLRVSFVGKNASGQFLLKAAPGGSFNVDLVSKGTYTFSVEVLDAAGLVHSATERGNALCPPVEVDVKFSTKNIAFRVCRQESSLGLAVAWTSFSSEAALQTLAINPPNDPSVARGEVFVVEGDVIQLYPLDANWQTQPIFKSNVVYDVGLKFFDADGEVVAQTLPGSGRCNVASLSSGGPRPLVFPLCDGRVQVEIGVDIMENMAALKFNTPAELSAHASNLVVLTEDGVQLANCQLAAGPCVLEPMRFGRRVIEVRYFDVNGNLVASSGVNGREIDVSIFGPIALELRRRETPAVRRTEWVGEWFHENLRTPWLPRDSATGLVFKGSMWLLGGFNADAWATEGQTFPLMNDVWRSTNAATWTRAGRLPDTECQGTDITLAFARAEEMLVGCINGTILASTDGATWTTILAEPPFGARYGAGHTYFAGKFWVMGGHDATRSPSNDVWSSPDGRVWTLETAAAPWSPRIVFNNLVTFKDEMWLIGGGLLPDAGSMSSGFTDVWKTKDGRNWELVQGAAAFDRSIWNGTIVYRGRMWRIGGYTDVPVQQNLDTVWSSANGVDWTLLPSRLRTGRHAPTMFVHDDKLVVAAGNAWPLLGEVVSLYIPGLVFLTNPPQKASVGEPFRYAANADFNDSGLPIRFRLVSGPAWAAMDDAGVVTGTPSAEKPCDFVIEAFDDAGETKQQRFLLNVL